MNTENKHEKVGLALRELREEKGMTIQELADLTGVYASTISRIENGYELPREMTLDKIGQHLGESNFYESCLIGKMARNVRKKEDLKSKILAHAEEGTYGEIGRQLMELREVISEGNPQDMQFYLALQNLWYEKNGVSVEERSKRYIEIFEMVKGFPDVKTEIDKELNNLELTKIEKLIINNIGIAFTMEGKPHMGAKVFEGLLKIVSKEGPKDHSGYKRLARLTNNMAYAAMKAEDLFTAEKMAAYSITYASRSMDLKSLAVSLKTAAAILEHLGKTDEAQAKYKYVENLEQILEENGTDMDWFRAQTDTFCHAIIL